MMPRKQLWLLAGGNGAGKTSFYRTRLASLGIPFVNADQIAATLYPEHPEQHSYETARIAEEMRYRLLNSGQSFCFETVFSHPSKIDFVARAKALGYQTMLVVIHLSEISLNMARIGQRVADGGHSVPEHKVEQRIPRLLENLRIAIPLFDEVRLLDNSSADNPFVPIARVSDGATSWQTPEPPSWAQDLLIPSK